jgi:hypothetical protein
MGMGVKANVVVLTCAALAALALPPGGELLGLPLFWARALGIVTAFLLLYPVVIARRSTRSFLAWTGCGSGASVGRPRCRTIRGTTDACSMSPTRRSRPPQRADARTSRPHVRRINSAH